MNDAIAGHVRARRPGVFHAGRRAPLADPLSVFRWLVAAGDKIRAGDGQLRLRMYDGGAARHLADQDYPRESDRSIGGYVERIGGGRGMTGFVVNNFQAAHPDAWRLAQSLMARLPVRPVPASFEIFAGDYRQGFFGVHKDDQDVITFVLEGKKRFLVWPYETFANHPGVEPGSELETAFLRRLDVARYRDQAIVVEGEAGDILYWPAEYWHVAESDGGVTATLGLGLFADSSPFRLVERAACELAQEGAELETEWPCGSSRSGGDSASFLGALHADLVHALGSEPLRRRLEEKALAHRTSFGLVARPDPEPLEKALDRDSRVRMPLPAALAWSRSESSQGPELLWSVSGAVFRYPYVEGIVRLFEKLTTGADLSIGRLLAELESEEITGEALLHIIEIIRRHHALVPGSAA